MYKKKYIAVFASGSGTNFINIYNNAKYADIVILISNNLKCGAIDFAIKNKIDFKIINDLRFPKKIDQMYEKVLKAYDVDLILLAGFMKKIPSNIIKLYENKIMNIHPSLLPKYGGKDFYGIKVHEAVMANKEKITGATIHFVNEEYDKGLIILQEKINVTANDDAISISKKVLKLEYQLYLKAIDLFCLDKIVIKNNMVKINEKN